MSQATCGTCHMLLYTLSKLWFCFSHSDLKRFSLGHQMSLLMILCELNPQHIWRKAATWQNLDSLTLAKVDLGGLCCQSCHKVVESCCHVRVRCSWCPGSFCSPSLMLLSGCLDRDQGFIFQSGCSHFNLNLVHILNSLFIHIRSCSCFNLIQYPWQSILHLQTFSHLANSLVQSDTDPKEQWRHSVFSNAQYNLVVQLVCLD